MDEIQEATIKVIAGPEKKSHKVTPKEKRLTAFHEAGHAVCTYYCDHQDKVHQVSIIPRGMAGGYTMSLPEQDKSFVSKKEMEETSSRCWADVWQNSWCWTTSPPVPPTTWNVPLLPHGAW